MRLPIGDVTIAIPKGDHLSLTMPNGYSVSITRMAMTYCGGDTAETAIISPTGQFVAYDGDDVRDGRTSRTFSPPSLTLEACSYSVAGIRSYSVAESFATDLLQCCRKCSPLDSLRQHHRPALVLLRKYRNSGRVRMYRHYPGWAEATEVKCGCRYP